MPKTARKPSYLLHKPTGQARVILSGKTHYLGAYGSPESRERYDRLISDWLAQRDIRRSTLRIDDLAILYIRHADSFYRKPDGKPTSEPACIRHALRFLVASHGRTLVAEFGPLALKAVRQKMVDAGLARSTINKAVYRIRKLIEWGVENEIAPASVAEALRCVAGLKAGRTTAVEPPPVLPVEDSIVEATLPCLPETLRAMVRLQLLTGARPGEICAMRPCDVTFGTDGVWTYRPASHKTQHHGKERRIFIGPRGQDVLRPFLNRPAEQHCFRPVDSEAQRNAARRAARKSPMTPSQESRSPAPTRKRPLRERYTKDGYCRAVTRACRKAGVEPWAPNQLRHAWATLLRKRHGIEAARLVLGHSDAGITLVYAERDFDAAAKIQAELG